jgi:NADPH:quinone reductase-like Zn-dependent oxidoreductase
MERSVLPLLASGAVRVPVAETYPLERAEEAYDHFAGGGKLGKIVLTAGG